MGFFNKILVQETKTGNLIDITNLDLEHYESFLTAMQKLQTAYIIAKENKLKPKSRCCGRCDGVNDICVTDQVCEKHTETGCEICFGER
jgi:hypothetical protein